MFMLKNPVIAAALAAALAGSTGYCTITNIQPPAPAPAPAPAPPTRLLPDAILPYPLEDEG